MICPALAYPRCLGKRWEWNRFDDSTGLRPRPSTGMVGFGGLLPYFVQLMEDGRSKQGVFSLRGINSVPEHVWLKCEKG